MNLEIVKNESIVRLSFFFGIFFLVALWEIWAPRRKLTQKKSIRWFSNLGIVALNTALVRGIYSTSAVGFSFLVKDNSWGLFNQLSMPFLL